VRQSSQAVERGLKPDEVARGVDVGEVAESDHKQILRCARVPRARSR